MTEPTLTRSLQPHDAPLGHAHARRKTFTHLVVGSLVALPIVTLAAFGQAIAGCANDDPPKIAHTKRLLDGYAHDGYPEWRRMHHGQHCPRALEELHPAMNLSSGMIAADTYGTPLRFICTTTGILVWSVGEDAKPHTADDLWSDAR